MRVSRWPGRSRSELHGAVHRRRRSSWLPSTSRNRDLIGFVDGTENPVGRDAVAAVTVGDEDPEFAGGSYVHIQRYIHKMRGLGSNHQSMSRSV